MEKYSFGVKRHARMNINALVSRLTSPTIPNVVLRSFPFRLLPLAPIVDFHIFVPFTLN